VKRTREFLTALASGALFRTLRGTHVANKKWLWIAAASGIAAVFGAPRIARAYKLWEYTQRQAAISAAQAAVSSGADGLPVDVTALLDPDANANDPNEADDATVRALVMAAEIGPRPPEAMQQLLQLVAQERAKWADIAPAVALGASTPGTRVWSNIGPLAARSQFNGTYYKGMDTGRPTAIAMDPGNVNGIFVAFSGGGVWYAPDFVDGNYPSWKPITETLGFLGIGAMAISPTVAANGDRTVWLGLGDAFDQKAGLMVSGTYNPGTNTATWGTPIPLGVAAPPGHPADGFPVQIQDVRDLKIDPANANHVLVATNDGLYVSTNAASLNPTFTLVDLPNATTPDVRESTWSIVYAGTDPVTTQGVWLVSGVYACPTIPGQTTGTSPPLAGAGLMSCGADTAHWNMGDIWRSLGGSADATTWSSLRASLPAEVTASRGNDIGRIALGTGATSTPGGTVIYAQASTSQEATTPAGCNPYANAGTAGACTVVTATAWYLKSSDSGATWTRIASGLAFNRGGIATATAVSNPSTLSPDSTTNSGGQGCTTVNVGHVQSWYNLTVAVDPQNSNRSLFGGDLCSIRTTDGGATYANASNWLPQSGLGFTAFGFLPYVHADWHTSLAAVQPNGQTMLLAGTDGGVFVTRNIWDVSTPELAQWQQPDVGITTHLFYGIGTGDPTLGNPNIVFGGLQDNGTRWRLVADNNFIDEFNPGNWDQILGGDGLGAAATSDTNGQNQVYWISVNGSRRFCVPRTWDCSQATRLQNGVEAVNWRNPGTVAADPFLIRYDPLGDDTSGVASASNTQANIWFVNPTSLLASVRNVVPSNSIVVDGTVRTIRSMGLRVSPYRYTIDGVPNTRIYGGVTLSSTTSTGSFLAYEKPNANGTFTSTVVAGGHGIQVPGVTSKGTGTIWIGFGSDFAAPPNPQILGGTDSKLTWLASSNAVVSNAVGCANPASATCDPAVFIPASVGHVFLTTDGGNSWTPFHGNGTGFDLPNFPVYVLRYDPTDATGNTLWVGTEFGVYRTTDGGKTFAPYGNGLPAVRITDIRISNNGSLVRVSTYGRGVWEIYPNSEPPTVAGSGDFDQNHVIEFFDMASLAARMGSSPTVTNNLVYDSSLDLDANSTNDEADLTALVAKFGSNQ